MIHGKNRAGLAQHFKKATQFHVPKPDQLAVTISEVLFHSLSENSSLKPQAMLGKLLCFFKASFFSIPDEVLVHIGNVGDIWG